MSEAINNLLLCVNQIVYLGEKIIINLEFYFGIHFGINSFRYNNVVAMATVAGKVIIQRARPGIELLNRSLVLKTMIHCVEQVLGTRLYLGEPCNYKI